MEKSVFARVPLSLKSALFRTLISAMSDHDLCSQADDKSTQARGGAMWARSRSIACFTTNPTTSQVVMVNAGFISLTHPALLPPEYLPGPNER